jgi:hypothetical protein
MPACTERMMRRANASDAPVDPADHVEMEQPLQALGRGGNRGLMLAVLGVGLAVMVLVWQPWGRAPSRAETWSASATSAAGVAPASAALPSTSTSGPERTGTYVSLIDHEWTVVALLTTGSGPSTEEPALQHGVASVAAGEQPLLVLQQGLRPLTRPVDGPDEAATACTAGDLPRDRWVVPLPAGRVVYLGVTVPAMDPDARVTVTRLGRPASDLRRAVSIAVPLAGLTGSRRYTMPISGPGAAILFATSPPSALPPGAYRFDALVPGTAGGRYLYACIGP